MVYTKETVYCWWPQYYWKEYFYIFKLDFRFSDFHKCTFFFLFLHGRWLKKNNEILKSDSWNTEFLGMFFSFHERKVYTQKKKALFYNLFYSSLLQIVFSVQYVNLHHQIKFHTCLTLITHQQPTSCHILSQKCSSQHSLKSSTRTASGAAGQHGATGTHRNKLLLVDGLKVTPFIEWWLVFSSVLPHIRRWKLLFSLESSTKPMVSRTVWPLWAPEPVLDHSYCEILIELNRISLAVTHAPCLSAFPSVSLRRIWLGFFYHHPFGS